MKKMVSLFLSVLLMLSCVGVANAAETKKFQDVPEGAWYRAAVYDMAGKGVLNGTGEKSFSPDDYMTRAMFAQVLYNITEKKTTVDYGVKRFIDTNLGDWYYDAVQWAGINKISNGVTTSKYDPNGILTREQAVTLLFNYILATGNASYGHEWDVVGAFADGKSVSSWAQIPMECAITGGFINGVTPHTLEPQAYLTRAQAAQILSRAYPELKYKELVPEDTGKTAPANPILNYMGKTIDEVQKDLTLVQIKHSEPKKYDEYYVDGKPSFSLLFYDMDNDSKIPKELAAITADLKDVLPELSEKTVGEAIRLLGRESTCFTPHGYTDGTPRFEYLADGFCFVMPVADDLTFDKNTRIMIHKEWQFSVNEGPDDGNLTHYLNEKPLFTYTLPTSWKDKYLLLTDNSMANGYQNYEVHERINYVRGESGFLFSFRVLTNDKTPLSNEKVVSQIEIDSNQYTICIVYSDFTGLIGDDEAIQSYQTLKKDIDQIVKSIEYPKDVNVK